MGNSQAKLQNDDGIFLFDMGDSIKLLDVINKLISYYEVKDIEIKITGLRSGEKLYEELNNSNEKIEATTDEKINLIKLVPTDKILIDKINQFLNDFNKLNINELKKINHAQKVFWPFQILDLNLFPIFLYLVYSIAGSCLFKNPKPKNEKRKGNTRKLVR